MKCPLYHIIVMFLAFQLGYTQEHVRMKHLSLENGLPSNYISSILQDSKGYLWFGTFNGLVKYDGYNFTVYTHDPLDTTSISNNEISALYQDSYGLLWIGTNGGGLNMLNPSLSPSRFTRYPHAPNNTGSNERFSITAIYPGIDGDKEGFWIGGNTSLLRFDRKSQSISSPSYSYPLPLPVDSITAKFSLDVLNNLKYSSIIGNVKTILNNGIVHPILSEKNSNTVWLGTDGAGLIKFNPDEIKKIPQGSKAFNPTEFITRYQFDPSKKEGLSDNFVTALFQDRSNVLWVGTYRGGLNILSKERDKFTTYHGNSNNPESFHDSYVRSLFVDRDGIIWIGGTSTGLTSYNKNTDTWKNYSRKEGDVQGLSHNSVRSLYEDRSGILWIGTDYRLDKFNKKTGRFETYHSESRLTEGSQVLAIVPEKDTINPVLWIGTFDQGLFSYNPIDNTFEHFSTFQQGSIRIYTLYFDTNGLLLVGTYGSGLWLFDSHTRTFIKQYSYSASDTTTIGNNIVLAIYEDSKKRVWLGTDGGGLNLYNRAQGNFTRFTVKNGLPSNTILGILEDEHGNLWLSTVNGLSKFSPDTKTFRNYTVSDGLMSKEFNGHAVSKTEKGEMFFGGANGFISFYPDSVIDNPFPPQVVITGLFVNDTSITTDTSIDQIQKVTLSYTAQRISFEFAGLHYTDPERNAYAYMMEGFESHWTYCGTRRTATYTNLDPGDYTFLLKASNCDGVWNETGTSIHLVITPPYWKTWWFRIFTVIVLIVSLGGIVRFIEKRKILKRIEKLEQDKAVERERLRISRDMHDDVGSRLSELSMVSSLAQRTLHDVSETERHIIQISRTTEDIINSLDEIVWAVNPENDSLKDLADYLCQYSVSFLSKAGVPVQLDIPTILPDLALSVEIRHSIFMVTKEALNNIVKYAGATNVIFKIFVTDTMIDCKITDNGKGFSLEIVQKFSYGIKNMQKRIEEIHGTFELSTIKGTGTTIHFEVPIT